MGRLSQRSSSSFWYERSNREFFQLQVSLLDIEREFHGMSRRAGIYEALEDRLRAGLYSNAEEALAIRQMEENRRRVAVGEKPEHTAMQQSLFDECDADEME